MKLYVLLLLISLILAGGCVDSSKQQDTSTQTATSTNTNGESDKILKPDLELLPTERDLPTEYKRVEPHPINLSGVGFESGIVYATSRSDEDLRLAFTTYRFNTPSNASAYYDTFVKGIEDSGGYTKLSASTKANCFSYKKVLGSGLVETGKSICLRKNVVFVTEVTSMLTNVDSTTKEMTKLFDSTVS